MNPKQEFIDFLHKENISIEKIRGTNIIKANSRAIFYIRYSKNLAIAKTFGSLEELVGEKRCSS
ncbi:MAG: hypothetical protein NTX50_29870 [Candidatus Sumerlaeota bacterium]|nr:hypothetical protein [Candidatus Sumerlaeota bacterium]